MHQCMDTHPISTCTRTEERLGEGWRCFVFLRGESCVWGMERGGEAGGLVINTPGPRSPGRLEARLVTRVNTRGTWTLTLLMGHRKPSTNWYPLCRIPPQDLSHQPLGPASPPPPKIHRDIYGISFARLSPANVTHPNWLHGRFVSCFL